MNVVGHDHVGNGTGEAFLIEALKFADSQLCSSIAGKQRNAAMHNGGEDVAEADAGMTAEQKSGAVHGSKHGRACLR